MPIDSGVCVNFIPFNYHDNITDVVNGIKRRDVVIFADCLAYEGTGPNVVDIANEIEVENLYIFDHHKTAIEWLELDENKTQLEKQGAHIFTTQNQGESACYLIYKILHGYDENMDHWVTLLSKYDTFDKSNMDLWNNKIYPFQMYLKYICQGIDFTDMKHAVSTFGAFCKWNVEDFQRAYAQGKTAINIVKTRNIAMFKSNGFVGNAIVPAFEEPIKIAFCSDYLQNSVLFEDAESVGLLDDGTGVIPDVWILAKYHFKSQRHAFPMHKNSTEILSAEQEYNSFNLTIYSRSDKYPADKIASNLGGGGHEGAAGCFPRYVDVREIRTPNGKLDPKKYVVWIDNVAPQWTDEELETFVARN
jgi:oligoribonuclease NrnB/cAMP/cGMP phosphodiesterase (DHH superfamily)